MKTDNTTARNRSTLDRGALVQRCIEHLDQEISLLTRFIEFTEHIHTTLGVVSGSDPPQPENQQELLSASDAVAKARQLLNADMSRYLNVPARQATIRKLSEQLPLEQAQKLEQKRATILELELRLQHINQTNTLLLRQSLDVYQNIILGITGQKSAAPTYSQSGQIDAQATGNLLQADC